MWFRKTCIRVQVKLRTSVCVTASESVRLCPQKSVTTPRLEFVLLAASVRSFASSVTPVVMQRATKPSGSATKWEISFMLRLAASSSQKCEMRLSPTWRRHFQSALFLRSLLESNNRSCGHKQGATQSGRGWGQPGCSPPPAKSKFKKRNTEFIDEISHRNRLMTRIPEFSKYKIKNSGSLNLWRRIFFFKF